MKKQKSDLNDSTFKEENEKEAEEEEQGLSLEILDALKCGKPYCCHAGLNIYLMFKYKYIYKYKYIPSLVLSGSSKVFDIQSLLSRFFLVGPFQKCTLELLCLINTMIFKSLFSLPSQNPELQ